MKTISIIFAGLVSLAASLSAQVTGPDPSSATPDSPFYGYSGDQSRGGVLSTSRQSDRVWGTAQCFSGYFSSQYPYGWWAGGILSIRNQYPSLCGPLNYFMNSQQLSYRPDQVPDHIRQQGLAWWLPDFPSADTAFEACNLLSNVTANDPGGPYVTVDVPALCEGAGMGNPF